MGWDVRNIASNVSGMFKDDPAEIAAQNFLKDTVFKYKPGFSAVEKFSDDNAEKVLDNFFTEKFKNTPPPKCRKLLPMSKN